MPAAGSPRRLLPGLRARAFAPSLVAVLGAAFGGCGKKGEVPPSAPQAPTLDLSTPERVLAQAHARLLAGDLAGMAPFLTARGSASIRRDLEAWRALLVDPVGGPRLAARLAVPDDPTERASLSAALSGGDPSALLRLYLRADPHPPLPPAAPVPRVADVTSVELAYPARDGETRRVVLVRAPDGWRIDRFAL